jgi:hypothetical protein
VADADRPASRRWAIRAGSIELDGRLSLSFQIAERAGAIGRRPRTLGVAPIALAPPGWDTDIVVPVGPEEAVWLGMEAVADDAPVAIRLEMITAASIDALTGEPWTAGIMSSPQNYAVAPPQRSLHGVQAGPDRALQFHGPAPAGEPDRGAIRLLRVYAIPPRAPVVPSRPDVPRRLHGSPPAAGDVPQAGGTVEQRILADPYGAETWLLDAAISVRIGLVSPDAYRKATGDEPPSFEASRAYTGSRLP